MNWNTMGHSCRMVLRFSGEICMVEGKVLSSSSSSLYVVSSWPKVTSFRDGHTVPNSNYLQLIRMQKSHEFQMSQGKFTCKINVKLQLIKEVFNVERLYQKRLEVEFEFFPRFKRLYFLYEKRSQTGSITPCRVSGKVVGSFDALA